VAAPVDLVEVGEFGVSLVGPVAPRPILLAWDDGHRHPDRDALRVEETALEVDLGGLECERPVIGT
jgi:hypothetical protein